MRLLTAGHVTRDRYGDGFLPGGSVWYIAHAWAATGSVGCAITAANPSHMPPWPGEVVVQPADTTTTFHNTYDATGRTMRIEGVAPPVSVAAVPTPWRHCDGLLLAPVAGELDPRAWLGGIDARIKVAGLQGWMRVALPDGHFVGRPSSVDPAVLAGLDLACLSDEDLGGDHGWLEALRAVVPAVVLTHGAGGCTVFEGADTTKVPVTPVDEVDPTGAGDTFAAGLVEALAAGMGTVEAARRGAALAGRCVAVQGPVSSGP